MLFVFNHYLTTPPNTHMVFFCVAQTDLKLSNPLVSASQHAKTTSLSLSLPACRDYKLHLTLFSVLVCLLCTEHCFKSFISIPQL